MAEATTQRNATTTSWGPDGRKTSVARVRLRPGKGQITINSRPMDEYFHNMQQRNAVLATLIQTGKRDEVDVVVRVDGGGITGQADAIKLGIARAMKKYSMDVEGGCAIPAC